MNDSIHLYLVTGFLGSGKTTFLTNLIGSIKSSPKELKEEKNSIHKIGIIENEFGEVGFDGTLLKDDEIQISEIDNGSIFCSCRHDSFIEALQKLAEYDLDIVFIESSGISDPAPIKDDLSIVNSKFGPESKYLFRGCIAIIDGDTFLEAIEVFESITRQIKHSHIVLINKVDCISEEKIKKIEQKIKDIKEVHPPVIETTQFGKIKFDKLNQLLLKSKSPEAEPSLNTPLNQPQSFTLISKEDLDKDDLEHFLLHFADKTFRIKGFCNFRDEGMMFVDGVGKNVEYKKFPNAKLEDDLTVHLVIILKKGDPLGDIIRDAWSDHFLN